MERWTQRIRRYVNVPVELVWRLIRLIAPLAPDEALHRIIWAFSALFLTTVVGVVGYVLIEDFTPFDALYQTVLTLTTVGFQEVHPLSRAARAFTIFLMVFGVGTALYLLTAIATLVLEGDVYRDIGERRRRRMIEEMSGHTIFVGAGRMGMLVAEQLANTGLNLLVIEQEPKTAMEARERDWMVLADNAEHESVLRTAGIERAESLYVMTGTDAVNMVITVRGRKLAPDIPITARVNDPENKELLLATGASQVFSLGDLLAREVMTAVADRG